MAETVATAGSVQSPPRHAGALLAVACAAQFVCVLDTSIVNVALPPMQDTLGLSPTGLQWVVSSYTLTFAGFLLLGGRVGDLFGRKRAFVAGLVLFVAGEPGGRAGAGGLAGRRGAVRPGRGRRGAGADDPQPRHDGFPEPRAKAKALSLLTAAAAAGGALGGVIGGVLTGLLSWRWVFFVNVPLGSLLLLAAVWALPGRPPGHVRGRLDLPGSISVTVGTAALVAAVILGEEHGFGVARDAGLLRRWRRRRPSSSSSSSDGRRSRSSRWTCSGSGRSRWPTDCPPWSAGRCRRRCSSSRCTCSGCSAWTRSRPGSRSPREPSGIALGARGASRWIAVLGPRRSFQLGTLRLGRRRCSGCRGSTSRAATPSTCWCR